MLRRASPSTPTAQPNPCGSQRVCKHQDPHTATNNIHEPKHADNVHAQAMYHAKRQPSSERKTLHQRFRRNAVAPSTSVIEFIRSREFATPCTVIHTLTCTEKTMQFDLVHTHIYMQNDFISMQQWWSNLPRNQPTAPNLWILHSPPCSSKITFETSPNSPLPHFSCSIIAIPNTIFYTISQVRQGRTNYIAHSGICSLGFLLKRPLVKQPIATYSTHNRCTQVPYPI